METGLCGPQNTGPGKSPCLSTSLTCWALVGGLFASEMHAIYVLMVVLEYVCGGVCDELRLNLCVG